jgi:hypothetical protein
MPSTSAEFEPKMTEQQIHITFPTIMFYICSAHTY